MRCKVKELEHGINQLSNKILCTNSTNEPSFTAKIVENIENQDLPDYKEKEETSKVSVIKRNLTDNKEGFQIDIESLLLALLKSWAT